MKILFTAMTNFLLSYFFILTLRPKCVWLKTLSQGLVQQMLIELSPLNTITDSKRLVTGTI